MSFLLNAIFHHSLLFIPQQEIPGQMPAPYVIRHPATSNVEVWWSPCPSRECPEEEEIYIVVDHCIDHCLMFEPNPKIELVPPPTKQPSILMDSDTLGVEDLDMRISKRIQKVDKGPQVNQNIPKVLGELICIILLFDD